MKGYLLKNLLGMLLTLFFVSALIFIITYLIPGEPAAVLAGSQASAEEIAYITKDLGLDQPVWTQFANYLKALMMGDFGESYAYRTSVKELIYSRFGNTLILTLFSISLAIVIGVSTAFVSAVHHKKLLDRIFYFLSTVFISLPSFWLSILLVLLFSVTLGWLPSMGIASSDASIMTYLRYLILPGISMTLFPTARIYRMARSAFLLELKKDYVTYAYTKGLKKRWIFSKYILKNSLADIINTTNMIFIGMLGGSVIIETIFSWPGLGGLITDAIGRRDIATIRGVVIFIAALYIVSNFLLDLLLPTLNPAVLAERKAVNSAK